MHNKERWKPVLSQVVTRKHIYTLDYTKLFELQNSQNIQHNLNALELLV